jgi:hypothetical protein
MKRILIIVLLLHISSLLVLAQKSYKERFDSQASIKQEQVKTDILYNRVVPWAKINEFATAKDQKTDTKRFIQAWYELQLAHYEKASPLSLQNVQDIISSHNFKRQIPIGVLNYAYNYLDSNAIAQKKYKRISTQEIQMAVALQTENLKAGEHKFVLNPQLVFGNLQNNIAQIRIEAGENNQVITFTPPIHNHLIIKYL